MKFAVSQLCKNKWKEICCFANLQKKKEKKLQFTKIKKINKKKIKKKKK